MSEELALSYKRAKPSMPSQFAVVVGHEPGNNGRPAAMIVKVKGNEIRVTQASSSSQAKYTVESVAKEESETYIQPGSIIRMDNVYKSDKENQWQTSFIKRVSNGPTDPENCAVTLMARPLPPARGATKGALDIITKKHSQKAADLANFDSLLRNFATSKEFPFIKAGIVGTRCIFISERANTRCHRIYIPNVKVPEAGGGQGYREMTSAELASHLDKNPTVVAIRNALRKGMGKNIVISAGFSAVVPLKVAESLAYDAVIKKCSDSFAIKEEQGKDAVVLDQIGFKLLNVSLFNGFPMSINTADYLPATLNAIPESMPIVKQTKTAAKESAQNAAAKAANALADVQKRMDPAPENSSESKEPAGEKFGAHIADDSHLASDYDQWNAQQQGGADYDTLAEYERSMVDVGRQTSHTPALTYAQLEDMPYKESAPASEGNMEKSSIDDKSDEILMSDESLDELFATPQSPAPAMN